MAKIIEVSEADQLVPVFDAVLLEVKVAEVLVHVLVDLELRADLAAVVPYEEQRLDVEECWREDVDLFPVQAHVDEHELVQVRRYHLVRVLAF